MKAIWLAAALALAGCTSTPPRATTPAVAAGAATPVVAHDARKAGARVSAVPLRTGPAMTGYGVILPDGVDGVSIGETFRAALTAAGFEPEVGLAPVEEVGFLPDLLDRKSYGLDDTAIASIRRAKTMLVAVAEAPVEKMVDLELAAVAAIHAATETGGWIYDPTSGDTFSRTAFAETRVGQPTIDVRRWIAVHFVSMDDGTAFLETRGLVRFGVPELFLRGVPRTAGVDANELVNAAAQLLMERGALTADGELAVRGAKGTITWTVTWSTGDYGADTPADLLELTLPGEGDVAKRLYEAIETFGGLAEDEVIGVDHDDAELQAARVRAKKALAALAGHFANGIPELEQLLVKAPFPTGEADQNEWMWVEVHAWKGDTLSGVLISQPALIADLELGDRVEVQLDTIFDYHHRHADGTEAGGETTEIIKRKYVR